MENDSFNFLYLRCWVTNLWKTIIKTEFDKALTSQEAVWLASFSQE